MVLASPNWRAGNGDGFTAFALSAMASACRGFHKGTWPLLGFSCFFVGRLLPFPFQLLLENLRGRTLVSLGKAVEWQQSNSGNDVCIDSLEGKHSTRLQCTDKARLGNRRSHTSISNANGIGNIHRAVLVDG